MRDFLHHLFLPRESNNHRAKLLHHKSLIIVIILLVAGQFFLSSIKTNFSDVLGTSTNISIERLVELTNQKRSENGLGPLTISDQLSQTASFKARDVFAKNYWAHNAPDGTTPWVFFKQAGYDYIYAGENLARGFATSDDTVNAWMASPSHRDNVLSPNYKEVGFAIMNGNLLGEDTTLVVEMFGSRNMPNIAKQEVVSSIPVLNTQVDLSTPASQQGIIKEKPITNSKSAIVASINTKPLIDNRKLSLNISLFIILLFIFVFAIDMIVIKRKKIVRLVGHNIDHIVFLGIILIFILLFAQGTIL